MLPEDRPTGVAKRTKLASLWRWGPAAFGALVFATLILVVLRRSDLAELGRLARNARPAMLLAAVLAQALTYACSAAVWRQFLQRAGYRRSLRTLVPLGLAKLFADQAMPPNGVGGAILVLHSLMRRGVPSRIGATAMLLALFAFYAAFLIVVIVSLALLWLHHRSKSSLTVAMIGFAIIAIGVPLLVFLARRYGAGRLRTWAAHIPGAAALLDRLVDAPFNLLRDPRLIAEAIGLHVCIFLLDAATLWFVLGALNATAPFWAAFVSYVIANVVATAAMVPMGLGTFEAGCIGMLTFLGVSLEAAFAATIALRGLTFWLPMAPGIWMASREMI